MSEQVGQLELFELSYQQARPHRPFSGGVQLHIRYDQLLIVGIGALIGITVLFAVGVERGKQLARAERPLLARQDRWADAGGKEAAAVPAVVAPDPAPAVPAVVPVLEPQPAPHAQPSTPTRKAPSKSRYAVQIVTYTQARFAQQELRRLQGQGESAFLVMRQGGQTVLYVGPFLSHADAKEKLTSLRSRYRDCFVKSL